VIAAAFIGPGTVTTAASAGAAHRYTLLWALAFSSLACLLLQEASARVTVVSGRDLGQALRERYRAGLGGVVVLLLVLGAIILGCAAYQAGNILGGVAGAALWTGLPPWLLTLACGLFAALLLWLGAPRTVARLLSVFVAVMGIAFLVTAWRLDPSASELLVGVARPSFPAGSGLLILGLVGTTVVPYNLFLGSGLARGQSLSELRFGLTVAVLLGGVISMAIVVAGAAVDGPFSYDALATVLSRRLGDWARHLFAAGLFAAGISSAITAPLAAAVTARSLSSGRWSDRSWRFRSVWIGVLAVGVGFGLAGVKPIPAILLAQALNGMLLPLVAVFLFLTVNDRRVMGARGLNGGLANILLGATVAVTVILGLANVVRAAVVTFGLPRPTEWQLVAAAAVLTALGAVPVLSRVRARRRMGRP
jgi:Mn2+/Fe2+ NRAMP family transporter